MRALATTGKTRSSVLPDVPTVSEAGVPGYEAVIWLGVMAPKGTPPAIVERAQRRDHARSPTSPRCAGSGPKQGASAMAMTPDDFARYVPTTSRSGRRS